MKLSYIGNPLELTIKDLESLISMKFLNSIKKLELVKHLQRRNKIRELAQKILDEKWYLIRDKNPEAPDWYGDCAFCLDAKIKTPEDTTGRMYYMCNYCLIGRGAETDNLICDTLCKAKEINDFTVVIEAIEELAKEGILSGYMKFRLENYEEVDG